MPKYLNADETLTKAGQDLAAELYNPGVGAVTKWLADGVADAYSRYGALPQVVLGTAEVDRYLREDIALETFMAALVPFLRNLDAGVYDEAHGTTVTTYFIGACRNWLGEVIRKHSRELDQLREDADELIARVQDPGIDAYDEIDGLDLARRVVLKAPHDLRAVLLLHTFDGMTLVEASKKLGYNPATIRSKLQRQKQKLARLHFSEDSPVTLPSNTALGAWAETVRR